MAAMMQTLTGEGRATKWVPWLLLGVVVLYFTGYVDGSVHAAALGSPVLLDTVHEFFHHGRHLAFMCH